MQSRAKNRARDLYELGTAVAVAFHEPDKLKELMPSSTVAAGTKEKGWWEQDA
jgi:hypothetical protein